MNILTIDLEDWFHILAHEGTSQPYQWEKFESRVDRNTDWILGQLEGKHKATFYCLGWIAERHPGLIRKIAASGHEVACHSMNHQLVFEQDRKLFKSDLQQAKNLLEDITGREVTSYRAPGFSVSEKTKWVFEVLCECGIKNDSSVFPAGRNHGGYPDFPSRNPCVVSINGGIIREFPMSMSAIAGRNFIFSGGGYFRIFPWKVIRSLMKKSGYVMTYFHPRDFDSGQPVLASLPLKRRLMSYTGLHGAGQKFERLVSEFDFVNIEEAEKLVEWDKAPVIALS